MKQFPILYSRTSTGAVQTWQIFVEGNAFWVVSGQIDGAKVTSEKTICEGKNLGRSNETSPEAQAEKEAEAKFKKKLKSEGYHKDIKDIDKEQYFQVMLAKSYDDYRDKIEWPVAINIKFNGSRLVASKNGLFTRKGERYISVPHIEETLKPFFAKYPDAITDGECFTFELREKLNELMSLVRKSVHVTPEDIQKSKEIVQYYIYDGFNFADVKQEDCYLKRHKAIMDSFFNNGPFSNHHGVIGKVENFIVNSPEELNKLYQSFIEEKHEGAIIRVLGAPYENKRSKYLLKFKPTEDIEVTVLDIKEGKGNWAGVAKIVCCKMDNGKEFDATFKGTYEQADECLKNKDKFIGKRGTIYFNGYTGLGVPNFAQFDINNYDKGH